jgi:vacuolar-type H+-ATPase subunit C/Vma6
VISSKKEQVMGLFRGSQVDKIVQAEDALEAVATVHGSKSHEAVKARGAVVSARNDASMAENLQASYEYATGDFSSREPFSGTRKLFS